MAAVFVGGLFRATFLAADAPAGASRISVSPPDDLGFPAAPFDATLVGETVRVVQVSGSTALLGAPLREVHTKGEVLQARAHPPNCRSNPYSSDGHAVGYADLSALHETLHALGIVALGALDYAGPPVAQGHLRGEPPVGVEDLMYQGDAPWGCAEPAARAASSPCKLDPSHRNYFRLPAGAKAIDLANSAFLDSTPPPGRLPPGW
jgi:hypothetical protein